MPNQPTEIILRELWLGPAPCQENGESFSDSDTLPSLLEIGITHIVNCTPTHAFPTVKQLHCNGHPVAQFRVPVPDEDNAPIQNYFDEASAFIEKALSGGGRVYVHCETGKSRSAAIVLAFRVRCKGESLRAAYDDTKAKRDYIQPKPAFFKHIVSLERERTGSTSFSDAEYDLLYLQDQFAPFSWVQGISTEEVEIAYKDCGEDRQAAHGRLMQIVQAAM
eukprot:TRINITY_DN34564_c0_g1_i1.p1 TRINITY_DN34564_c0_g1~~TRINITY_DN34564_c0_g1_i1.p1  ORF type:complete len:221 (-),score=24.88 TRINITY_DN34564_c0_g1_i1:168-830(-)